MSRSFNDAVSAQYIAVPNDARYSNLRQYTICAWVKPDGVQESANLVGMIGVKDVNGTYAPDIELYGLLPTTVTRLGFGGVADDDSTWSRGSAPNTVPADVWTHIAIAVDWDVALTTFPKLFANGVQVDSDSPADILPTSNSPKDDSGGGWYIGGDGFSEADGSYGIHGLVSDFRIYNRVLTPTEIASVYAGNDPAPASLIGRWKLCGSSPELDSSGNGANAIVNAPGSEDNPPTTPCAVMTTSSQSLVQVCM